MEETIKCSNISKTLGTFSLQDISFELPKGYILGVIGRNGCGKTTLLRTLMGLYRIPEGAGDIRIDDISVHTNIKAYKGQIAYVLNETPYIDFAYKVKDIGKIYGRFYESFKLEQYLSYIHKYNLPGKKKMAELSTGEQIKVQLAFALSFDANVYIFDEPTGNMDVSFRDEFYQVVRELVSNGDKTVIYATHLIEELEGFADYLLWMKKEDHAGKVKYFGTVDELLGKYQMLEGQVDEGSAAYQELLKTDAVIGGRSRENHKEILIKTEGKKLSVELADLARYADLKEIMYYEEKGGMV